MNTTKTLLLLAAGGAMALAWACGGSTATNGNTGDGGSGSGSGSSSGGGSGSSSGTASSSSGGGSGSSSGTASSSSGGGSGSSSGVPMPYMCNGQPCTAPDTCCTITSPNGTTLMCESTSACADAGGRSIACTSKENCPNGDYCCAHFMGGTGGGSTTCETMCPMGSLPLCNPANGNADCPTGDDCRTVQGGYGVCLRPRDGGPPPFDAGGRG